MCVSGLVGLGISLQPSVQTFKLTVTISEAYQELKALWTIALQSSKCVEVCPRALIWAHEEGGGGEGCNEDKLLCLFGSKFYLLLFRRNVTGSRRSLCCFVEFI